MRVKAILSRRTLGRWESGSTWVQGFPLESHILLFIEKKKSNCIREKKEGLELRIWNLFASIEFSPVFMPKPSLEPEIFQLKNYLKGYNLIEINM